MATRDHANSAAAAKQLLLVTTALVALGLPAAAQDSTWLGGPPSPTANYNLPQNWTQGVPTGTAFFDNTATTTTVQVNASTTVGGWTFNTTNPYTFDLNANLTFNGAGIATNGANVSIRNVADPTVVLSFTGNSTAGSSDITNLGNSNFRNNSTAGSAHIFNQAPSGQLGFFNNSTAGNARIDNVGSIAFIDQSTAGSASITNSLGAGGSLSFLGNSTAGSATIINNANGQLIFDNASTAGNANITNNGTMTIEGSATAGNATITNNGLINWATTLTNTARVINGSTGELRGFNNIIIGSIEGGGTIDFISLAAGSTLTVGTNNLSTTFSGALSQTDPTGGLPVPYSFTKVGTGTLTLTGTSNYVGATNVNGGTLKVDGSIIDSSVNVNNSARLSGSGFVARATINGGGTLAPGSGAVGSSLTIGNLVFGAGSNYAIQINSAGQSSKAIVNGSATLGGTVQVTMAPGNFSLGQSYSILSTTRGHSGIFDSVSGLNNFTTSFSYADPTQVFLTLTGAKLGLLDHLNTNQQNVANVINNFFNNSTLPANFSSLFAMSGPTLTNALSQISGEVGATTQQTVFTAMNQFMGLMTDPFIGNRGPGAVPAAPSSAFADESEHATAYAGAPLCLRTASERDACAMVAKAPVGWNYEGRWSQWVAGFGGTQSTTGNATLGSNATSSQLAGIAVGADYLISPDTLAGFAVAGSGSTFSVGNGLGSGRSDMFQAGAYLRHSFGRLYAAAALAYGLQDSTTDRTVTVAGIDQLHAQFNGHALSGRIEEGYRFDTPWMAISPYAAGQFTRFEEAAYNEQASVGTTAFALSYAAKTANAVRSEIGVRGENSFAMADGLFTLRERLAWAHDYTRDRGIAATFQTLPGPSFVVNGAAPAPNAALVTLSAEQKWLSGFSLAATFEGEFSEVTRSYAGKGVLRYVW